ncbi:hypothetical protein M9472_001893 [Salmonella enterica]|nr:hypothetical protein [Salmonella enterica]EJG3987736.1 hypothetical protein [Salmonella enterica]
MSEELLFTTELPEWFNLEQYTPFRSMSSKELALQLHYRLHTLMIMDLGSLDIFDSMYKDGIVIPENEGSKKYSSWVKEKRSEGRRLSQSLAISPINRIELSWMAMQKESDSYKHPLSDDVQILLSGVKKDNSTERNIALSVGDIMALKDNMEEYHRIEKENIDLLLPKSSNVHVKIDLSMPDRFIMEGLKGLLSAWRKQLNIPSPNPKLKASLSILRSNFINYRAFQIIDLKLWAKSKGLRYRDSFLHTVIFPDGDKTLNLDDFRKKAIPFADDVLDPRLPFAMLDMCRTEEENGKKSSEE